MPVRGIDPLDQAQLSKVEGQLNEVTDREVIILAQLLRVTGGWLLGEGG